MKEKVINARVTEELYKKIAEKAKKNQTTVSKLLRSLLEDSLDIASDLTEIVDAKIREYLAEEKIVGYQDIIVAQKSKCVVCETEIAQGDKAYCVVTDKGIKFSALICNNCFNKKED